MKIISFSLWGNTERYLVGAVENIIVAKEIYPDWKCRFYIDSSVPEKAKVGIVENGGEIVEVHNDNRGNFYGMFWRFFANDDPNMEAFISRDCDSRLSPREKSAVDEWMASDKCLHTMHDHRFHVGEPILGGAWGAKKGCIENMVDKINKWGNYANKGIDQDFLRSIIWNEVKSKTMSHSSVPIKWDKYIPFPHHAPSSLKVSYIGEIFDEKNNPTYIPW